MEGDGRAQAAGRILVIGGYGGFGARLSRRLAGAGHEVLVGGRSRAKAKAFCAGLPGSAAVELDREKDIAPVLAQLRPDLVVDAAGPFQGSGYDVPEACIAAGIPYLDLADARGFVGGIGALDAAARAAGVAAVSGASSLPALSSAVALKLAEGLDRVASVEMALSASNRASGGASVVKAILSYVGRPLPLWRGGRWSRGWGWQETRREEFRFADGSGLGGRLVALADVPDHDSLPALLPGRPAVTFRAGTELGFQMRALWLASWMVRWGWLRSLRPLAPALLRLYALTRPLGGERSAMKAVLIGRVGGRHVRRSWMLVAEEGEGLHVPTLAAALLAEDLLAGRIAAGARDASGLLTLERFEPAFARLRLRTEIAEEALPPPLYARVLGPGFASLPPAVRALHDFYGDAGAAGEGTVTRGRSPLAGLIGRVMGFPPSGTFPLHVAFAERGGRERWTRDFGGHVFASELSGVAGRIVERFGPLRFAFALPCDGEGLEMRLAGWSAFRVRLPRWLGPRIAAREWEDEEGRFRFEVAVALPMAGEVVRYAGWLRPVD